MGGGQTLAVGLAHLDLFGSLGVFSMGPGQDFETKYKSLLDDAKGTNAKLATFWIACGDPESRQFGVGPFGVVRRLLYSFRSPVRGPC